MKIPQIRCSDVNAVKRIIFLLVLLIPFCLAGCSSDDDEGDNGGEGPVVQLERNMLMLLSVRKSDVW